MTDYLSSICQNRFVIQFSHLFLQALSMKGVTVGPTQLFRAYMNLAQAYFELGYSGRTGVMLSVTKPLCAKVDADEASAFHLLYGQYLNAIGNYGKWYTI
jgi:hypothetical protein